MEEPKTLSYDWQYGREELFLRVDKLHERWTISISGFTIWKMDTRKALQTLR